MTKPRCHVCAQAEIDPVEGYEPLSRVASDCAPWPAGGRLGVCPSCGCVQKVIDDAWNSEVGKIYDSYSIYHQSQGGAEQSVFEASGHAVSRSTRLLECLRSHVRLPEAGRLLDVGCGNGALLRVFSPLEPSWSLAGTELNDKYRAEVERIERVEALFTCAPDQVPGGFDLITMVHVIEHIPDPMQFLARLGDKLKAGGLLVIEIPDYLQNPFDLVIADHSTHFTAATISALLIKAGYEVASVAGDWVPKELTVVARKAENRLENAHPAPANSMDQAVNRVRWLRDVVTAARRHSAAKSFGLFGTSIAAAWLFSELDGRVAFFADEDPSRVGRTYRGRPVYHPKDAPPGAHLFIPIPAPFGEALKARLKRLAPQCEMSEPPGIPP